MSKIYLKIKIKSLSEETRIIKFEERRCSRISNVETRSRTYFGLRDHRLGCVRTALRSSYLAYAFIRGKSRVSVENKCSVDPNYSEVSRLAYKYGSISDRAEFAKRLSDWLCTGEQYDLGVSAARDHINTVVANSIKRM
jgi:hypothetical protein